MLNRLLFVCAALVLAFTGSAQAALVSISNFSGADALDSVEAVASSEYPSPSFVISKAFDDDPNTAWGSNGNGTDGGDYPPNAFPSVTMDLSAATVNGVGGPFVIDTFTWFERRHAALGERDQTASFQLQAFLGGIGGTEVFNTTIDPAYSVWFDGVSVAVPLGGVIADTIVYTVLSRTDEQLDGNVFASEFRLTGSVVPEPASLILLGAGGLLVLRRGRR